MITVLLASDNILAKPDKKLSLIAELHAIKPYD